jgi:CBS domain-containing protein
MRQASSALSPVSILKEQTMNIAMKTVRDILRVKGDDIWSVAPDATVYDALERMAEKNVGALLVLDSGELVGVLSERDYARKVILQHKASRGTLVREIMTEKVVRVHPDTLLEVCMELMTDKHIRHLPVCEDDQLVGIVSIGDVVNAIIAEQKYIIGQLRAFQDYDLPNR